MSEKKNIVIKVKYPTPAGVADISNSAADKITEWNIRRIAYLVGGVFLGIIALYYLMGSNNEPVPQNVAQSIPSTQTSVTENTALTAQVPVIATPPATPINPAVTQAVQQVVRARLTHKIAKNEPASPISLPLKINRKETIGVYYFAELKGMKGQTVYHEWLLNDNTISRKKVNISSDPWRTSSKQAITYTMNNDWKVRIVDDSGKVLTEKTFNLELK
jgi:Protein of unknown function (DUF2914)